MGEPRFCRSARKKSIRASLVNMQPDPIGDYCSSREVGEILMFRASCRDEVTCRGLLPGTDIREMSAQFSRLAASNRVRVG